MCRRWLSNDGKARPLRQKAPFRGTIRYASSRALSQQECGPADDLIGWCYSLVSEHKAVNVFSIKMFQIELYVGHLPWAKIPNVAEVIRTKAQIPTTDLCEPMPTSFYLCFQYSNSLGCDVMPDYEKVQQYLHECLPDNCSMKDLYDWE